MEAVILVAGIGIRLKPLTDNVPKCLTEVCGKAILDNGLEILEQNGIKRTTLVIGYLGDKIRERIGDKFGDMDIRYVENKIYSKTNTSHSLFLAIKDLNLDSALLILEGDVFFENRLLIKFLSNEFLTSTVVQKYNPNLDGSFVEVKETVVVDWIHKNKRKRDFTIEDKFKTVNIHKFNSPFVNNLLKPVLEQHAEKEEGKEPIEYILQDIVTKRDGIIHAFETGDLKWFEIDDANDLKIAEAIFGSSKSI